MRCEVTYFNDFMAAELSVYNLGVCFHNAMLYTAECMLRLWPLLMLSALCLLLVSFSLQAMQASLDFPTTTPKLPSMYIAQEAQKNVHMNYGVIIDAGSSGSRVYVYTWPPHSGNVKDLMSIRPLLDSSNKPVMKKVSPGLSNMASSPGNATTYMYPLLEYAQAHIPKHKHKQTSLFIMATAGLRLLSEENREAILDNLRENVPKTSSFIILPEHIEMITGKWEGIYSWVAVNYALGKFQHNSESRESGVNTVGMIDIGGGSLQIAFEIKERLPKMQQHLSQKISLGCTQHDIEHDYRIYVSTFLGMGANSAAERYEQSLYQKLHDALPLPLPINPITSINTVTSKPNVTAVDKPVILDPCLPNNLTKPAHLESSNSLIEGHRDTSFVRKGSGKWEECVRNIKPLLNQRACAETPCSMNGIYQPPVPASDMSFYGFSECWYSTDDALGIGGKYNRDKFEDAAQEFCSTRWSTLKERSEKGLYPKADVDRLRTQCFKSALLASVLHDGFHFPLDWSSFTTVKNLDGQEVQWTLGALLYKMRHFPLKDIRSDGETHISFHPSSGWFGLGFWSQTLLLICLVLLVYALLKYLFVLRRLPRKYIAPKMPRSKSMWGYMMLSAQEDDPPLQGVRVESSQYVY